MINDPSLFMLMSTIIVCASGISAYFFISNNELSENHLVDFVIMMLIFIVFYGLISVALGLLAIKFFL